MKYFFALVCLLSSYVMHAQLEMRNSSLSAPSQPVVYRNFYNLLEFQSSTNDSILCVLIENDTVERYLNTFYIVPDESHSSIVIDVVTVANDTTQFELETRDIPVPELFLGELPNGPLSKTYLLNNPGLMLEYPDQSLLPFMYVIKCELILISSKGKETQLKVFGNAFSEKQLKKLSKLQAGDTLWFKNVQISCTTCMDNRISTELKLVLTD